MMSSLHPLFHSDLLITRVCVEEGKALTTGCRVNDLIDLREREVILRAVFVQRGEINTHAKDVCALLRDQNRVC